MSHISTLARRYVKDLYAHNVVNPVDRLRFYIYILCTALITLGVSLHFLGILGVRRPVLLGFSLCWAGATWLLFALFATRRIKVGTALISLSLVSQAVESLRVLYLATTHTITAQQFFINEFICYLVLFLIVISFFYRTSFLLTAINLVAAIAYRAFIPDIVNSMTITILILADIALCAYCYVSVSIAKQLTSEREEAKGKYNTFLSFMRMNDAEVAALVKLVRSPFDDERSTDLLVSRLNDETKANLINIANRIESRRLAKEDRIRQHFPQLTPTELTVCLHVVAGHTQKEIARILNKSENNISTVRGNIRRKLNMQKEQNLREYLMEAINLSTDNVSYS